MLKDGRMQSKSKIAIGVKGYITNDQATDVCRFHDDNMFNELLDGGEEMIEKYARLAQKQQYANITADVLRTISDGVQGLLEEGVKKVLAERGDGYGNDGQWDYQWLNADREAKFRKRFPFGAIMNNPDGHGRNHNDIKRRDDVMAYNGYGNDPDRRYEAVLKAMRDIWREFYAACKRYGDEIAFEGLQELYQTELEHANNKEN